MHPLQAKAKVQGPGLPGTSDPIHHIIRGILRFTPSFLPEVQTHLALIEGCRHSLEISVPVNEVESETNRVAEDVQKRAKLRGFRPGKAPASIIRKEFSSDIRQKVLENLIPK